MKFFTFISIHIFSLFFWLVYEDFTPGLVTDLEFVLKWLQSPVPLLAKPPWSLKYLPQAPDWPGACVGTSGRESSSLYSRDIASTTHHSEFLPADVSFRGWYKILSLREYRSRSGQVTEYQWYVLSLHCGINNVGTACSYFLSVNYWLNWALGLVKKIINLMRLHRTL